MRGSLSHQTLIKREIRIDKELNGRDPYSPSLEKALKDLIEDYSFEVWYYNIQNQQTPYQNKYGVNPLAKKTPPVHQRMKNLLDAQLPKIAPSSYPWLVPTVNLDRHLQKQPVNARFSNREEIQATDLKYTILDSINVTFRDAHELAELSIAVGSKLPPIDLVCFRPKRIALHQAITTVITQIQYIPQNAAEEVALEYDAIFLRTVQQVIAHIQADVEQCELTLFSDRMSIEAKVTRFVDEQVGIAAENDPIQQVVERYRQMLSDSPLGEHVDNYTQRQALIALTTDKIYSKLATKVMTELVETHVQKMIEEKTLVAIVPPKPERRALFLIAGGQASGKGSAFLTLKQTARAIGIRWPNVSKGGGDTFRSLLLDPKTVHPELFGQLTNSEASYVSHTLVKNKLEELAKEAKAPHLFIEQCYLGQDKIDLAFLNGGSAHIIFVSTHVESAVERSFIRGRKTGRYESIKGILSAHRGSTEQLPSRLKENIGKNLYVSIIDNNVPKGTRPTHVALISCRYQMINIYDTEKMLNFIKKTAINVEAQCYDECYHEEKIAALCIGNYFKNLDEYRLNLPESAEAESRLVHVP